MDPTSPPGRVMAHPLAPLPTAWRPRLLIVDDVPANVAILAEALTDDYEVQFANSGAEALQLASQTVPDLILLDIMMPGMDGYETCHHLQQDPTLSRVPVMFVTALSDPDNEATGLALGAADYITKPFDVGITRLRIRNLLERERLRNELQLALTGGQQQLWEWQPGSGRLQLDLHAAGGPEVSDWASLVHPDDLPALQAALEAHCHAQTGNVAIELRMAAAGSYRWFALLGRQAGQDDQGHPLRILGTRIDIHSRKQAEQALRDRELQLATLIRSLPDLVLSYDSDHRLTSLHLPDHLASLVDLPHAPLQPVSSILPAPLAESLLNTTLLCHDQQNAVSSECCLNMPAGNRYLHLTVNHLQPVGPDSADDYLAVIRDISKERQADEEIRRLAWHDALTGLPNRRQLLDRLRLAQLNSARTQQWAALLFVDLDNFKVLNDTWGHQSGVVLLEQLGGDETSARMSVQKVLDTLRGTLDRVFPLGKVDYRCSGSVGYRLFFGKEDDCDHILSEADQAMYHVKQSKRSNLCLFGSPSDPGI